MNINTAFSRQLIESAKTDKRIVVIDPEVARSTGMREFAQAHPQSFFEVGVAEQNALGISAGLAACGNLPFCVSFAPFATMRPLEMIRTSVGYTRQPVRIVGAYAAFTDGKDGATHEALEDVGMLRPIPNLLIVSPSDGVMAKAIVRASLQLEAPMYIRLENEDCPQIYDENFAFEIGRIYEIRKGNDVTIAAYGTATHRALEAAKLLDDRGISAQVLDVATLKPFDSNQFMHLLEKTGRLVILEDQVCNGGLASIAAEAVGSAGRKIQMRRLAVPDVFGLSGTPQQLREHFHLSAMDVVNAAMEMMNCEG